jgi:hypothetical protein
VFGVKTYAEMRGFFCCINARGFLLQKHTWFFVVGQESGAAARYQFYSVKNTSFWIMQVYFHQFNFGYELEITYICIWI